MAASAEMAGELEIKLMAASLQTNIQVHINSGIRFYEDQYKDRVIQVLYTNINERAGHYDAVLFTGTPYVVSGSSGVSAADISVSIPTTAEPPVVATQSSAPTSSRYEVSAEMLSRIPNLKKRKVNSCTTQSELLKSSPYLKRKEADKRQKDQKICQKRLMPEETGETWYCIICGEDRMEDMVKCSKCGTYIHESCAGGMNPKFTCDLC